MHPVSGKTSLNNQFTEKFIRHILCQLTPDVCCSNPLLMGLKLLLQLCLPQKQKNINVWPSMTMSGASFLLQSVLFGQ